MKSSKGPVSFCCSSVPPQGLASSGPRGVCCGPRNHICSRQETRRRLEDGTICLDFDQEGEGSLDLPGAALHVSRAVTKSNVPTQLEEQPGARQTESSGQLRPVMLHCPNKLLPGMSWNSVRWEEGTTRKTIHCVCLGFPLPAPLPLTSSLFCSVSPPAHAMPLPAALSDSAALTPRT